MKITVLGAGAWGTALARLLHRPERPVTIWGHNAERLLALLALGRNDRYLPGIELPPDWLVEPDLLKAAAGSACIVFALPSKAFREVAQRLPNFNGIAVSVTKGIESDTGLTMGGVLREVMPDARAVALSGPTLAIEVARGIPTAIVAGGEDKAALIAIQELLHRPAFRVYTTADWLGVELGGALKNVIAIAAGVGDGLGFGDNAKAALVTRGIAEIRRLGVASGAQAETFAGLSGLGDLTVTCFSRLSRNRAFGERLGRGEKSAEILATSVGAVEGYPTARSAWQLGRKLGVVTPIIDEVYAMLYEGKDVALAVRDLTGRSSKAED